MIFFRPFLFKTFNWAANEGGGAARLFPLYMLYAKMTEMMKSMFLIFTGSLTPHLVDILVKMSFFKYLQSVFSC